MTPLKPLFTLLLIGLSIASRSSEAAVDASSVVRHYTDTQGTVVTSPTVEVGATFNEDRMKLTAHASQDILSSASSEVRTFGSRGQDSVIYDLRNEFQINYEAQIPDGTLSAGVITSDENDYSSRVVAAGGTRELFSKNTVIGFGFANGSDVITATGDSLFRESMQHQVYSISLSQILNKNSLIQLLYDFRVENGYIASPYRRAKIVGAGGVITSREENHPRTRNRNAVGVKYNFYVPKIRTSFASSYRLYQDSWAIVSHTIEERITREMSRAFELALTLRYYTQSKANFYQAYYVGDPGSFFSGNNTLATYESLAVGLRPAYSFSDRFQLALKLEYFTQSFQDAVDAKRLETRDDDVQLRLDAYVVGLSLVAQF